MFYTVVLLCVRLFVEKISLDRYILLFIILFSICFILLSLFLAGISLGQNAKILIDFGLAMIEIFGLVTILFFGSQLIFKEIEGKTIYLILSKPIKRSEFILGKFF